MGKVYKARQLSLDKDVVIKILHDHFRDDPQLVQRFQREARAASRLNHPNSIQVIDFGQDDNGVLFMAIEFLNGRDLFGILKEDGPLSAERLAKMMIQVCSALAEAHAQNVIHRDLKPENIMIVDHRGTEHVKVLDFGIAKIQDPDETPGQALTQAGMVCGTPEYMSPEQARGLKLDHRSDLYALGVVCYQLVTGELPFTADSPIGIVTKHILEEPEPPAARFPNLNIPPALEQLIMKSMAKDADARFATATEMGTAFEDMLKEPQSAPVPVAPTPAPVGGTMVGMAAPTTSAASPGAPAPPAQAAHPQTGGSHPQTGGAEQSAPVVVKTINADAPEVGGTPTRPTPTAQKFDAVDAVNDDIALATGGGAAKWVALVALFFLLSAGGAVFAFKDKLFPPGDVVAQGPESKSPEANSPEAKSPEAKSPEAQSPEAATPKTAEPPAPEAEPRRKDPVADPDRRVVKRPSDDGSKPKTKDPKPTKARTEDGNTRDKAGSLRDKVKNGKKPVEAKVTRPKLKRDREGAKELLKKSNQAFASSNVDKAYALAKEAMRADPYNPAPLKIIANYHRLKANSKKACRAMKDYIKRSKMSEDKTRRTLQQFCGG